MRIVPVAAAAVLLAGLAACEERTVYTDPAVMNDTVDAAAEMNRPTYTPIELGNGTAGENAAAGNDATRLEPATVVAPENAVEGQ